MMAMSEHVHAVVKLLFELLDLPPRTLGGHSIPAQNPRDRLAASL